MNTEETNQSRELTADELDHISGGGGSYNQAETLASSVLKKRDDANSSVIGKL